MGTPLHRAHRDPRRGLGRRALREGGAVRLRQPGAHRRPTSTRRSATRACATVGGGLGSAGFIVYDDRTNMVEVARLASNFLYVESCGQCSPCKLGTGTITERLDRIARSGGDEGDVEAIGARLLTVTDANRCYLGTQEQVLVSSILRLFPEDVVAALEGGGIEGPGSRGSQAGRAGPVRPRPTPQARRLDLHIAPPPLRRLRRCGWPEELLRSAPQRPDATPTEETSRWRR